MDQKERPRTKRLERPTPNVIHPIIGDKTHKECDSGVKECTEMIGKCQTTPSKSVNLKSHQMKNNFLSTTGPQYKTTTISHNKFSDQKLFTTNKVVLLKRNRNENEIKAIKEPKDIIMSENTKKSKNGSNESTFKSSFQLKTIPRIVHSSRPVRKQTNEEKTTKSKNETKDDMTADYDSEVWKHFESQLIPCCHCFRTFFPHRLAIHERSCRGIGIGGQCVQTAPKPNTEYNANSRTNHTFLECNTCGRRYSTTSLTLHEIKCRLDTRVNNNNKRLSTGKGENGNDMMTAWEHFKSQLVSCRKCNRKFLSDRLEKHEPNCKSNPIIISSKINAK
ncbi:unnamed protein product [Medioppia subpectinata]|uniref:C2HC/C3H-type domain-containing protein n=1 Tax=Medioppia subpectinata TaxID=1979941 RepID=A0A7R9KWI0_9ACAR|nr:unnamed protein product [Medioppia subpectinata]CAG2111041.1 unnamed protein product [Medioppia subpectinata]